MKSAIPLGPELPLWKEGISSPSLFPSFLDRLPSKNNPAYKDYCEQCGINSNEQDILVLLVTIAHRGPSTFILEKAYENSYGAQQLKLFRQRLSLTQAEFEVLTGISHMTLVGLESSRIKNDFWLRYFELLDQVPQAMKWLLDQRGQFLHDEKRLKIMNGISPVLFSPTPQTSGRGR